MLNRHYTVFSEGVRPAALALELLLDRSFIELPPLVEECYRLDVVDQHPNPPEKERNEEPERVVFLHEIGEDVPSAQEDVPQNVGDKKIRNARDLSIFLLASL